MKELEATEGCSSRGLQHTLMVADLTPGAAVST